MKYEELDEEIQVLRKLLFKGRLGFKLSDEEKQLVHRLKQKHLEEGGDVKLPKEKSHMVNDSLVILGFLGQCIGALIFLFILIVIIIAVVKWAFQIVF